MIPREFSIKPKLCPFALKGGVEVKVRETIKNLIFLREDGKNMIVWRVMKNFWVAL